MRGKRYTDEPRLNIKKVVAVIVFIAVIIMFIIGIKTLLQSDTQENLASSIYFTVYTNDKYGVINSKGKEIIKPTYDEMIIVPNKTKAVFICTYNTNYENGTYNTKVLNEKGKEIFTDYSKVEPIPLLDSGNNLSYIQNTLKVTKNGKYGLINMDGKLILNTEYDDIFTLKDTENTIIIKKGESIGVSDELGNVIIEPKYKEIQAIENNYKYGYIVKNDEEKFGIIDANKRIILEPEFEEIRSIYGANKYVVKEDGDLRIIDNEKNVLLRVGFDDIVSINGDNVVVIKNGKYGVLNMAGEEKIERKYEDLKYAFNDYYISKIDGKYGIINLNNETVLEHDFTSVTYRKEGNFIEAEKENEVETLIYDSNMNLKLTGIISEVNEQKGYLKVRVGTEYKYYNFKFEEKENTELLKSNQIFLSKKDGKYGFVDKTGKEVTGYIYDDAQELNSYGYAAVKKGGLWGSIDENGKQIADFKYKLENNLVIDFIGKYHIGEDLNALYYTDK